MQILNIPPTSSCTATQHIHTHRHTHTHSAPQQFPLPKMIHTFLSFGVLNRQTKPFVDEQKLSRNLKISSGWFHSFWKNKPQVSNNCLVHVLRRRVIVCSSLISKLCWAWRERVIVWVTVRNILNFCVTALGSHWFLKVPVEDSTSSFPTLEDMRVANVSSNLGVRSQVFNLTRDNKTDSSKITTNEQEMPLQQSGEARQQFPVVVSEPDNLLQLSSCEKQTPGKMSRLKFVDISRSSREEFNLSFTSHVLVTGFTYRAIQSAS